jgi:DNA-binding NtrC family response regulator
MSGQPNGAVVLVVDNNDVMRTACQQALAKSGYQVTAVADAEGGLGLTASLQPAVVILDLYLPGTSGLDLIPRIRDLAPQTAVVAITGYPTIETAVAAMKQGATDFLPKPFTPDRLRRAVAEAIEAAPVLPP